MLVTLSGMLMEVRLVQFSNRPYSILVRESGSTTEFSAVQLLNTDDSMDVTLSGMSIEVSSEQKLKTDLPILVSVSGRVMPVMPIPSNILPSMDTTGRPSISSGTTGVRLSPM